LGEIYSREQLIARRAEWKRAGLKVVNCIAEKTAGLT
jgi:hypothetical protein